MSGNAGPALRGDLKIWLTATHVNRDRGYPFTLLIKRIVLQPA